MFIVLEVAIRVNLPVYEGVDAEMTCILPSYEDDLLVNWWRITTENAAQQIQENILSRRIIGGEIHDQQERFSNIKSVTTDVTTVDTMSYHSLEILSPTLHDSGQYWCEAVVDGEPQVSNKVNVTVIG